MSVTNNPYAPPKAELEVPADSNPLYYVVSIGKFSILFFTTFGLYSIYWFYRNWHTYRSYSGEKIWPVPRSIFSIFFVHSLFSKVQDKLDQVDMRYEWSPSSLATGYVLLTLIESFLNQLSTREIGSPVTDVFGLLMLPAIYYTLLIPQKAINSAEGDSAGTANRRLTPANYIWIVLGCALWAGNLLGLMIAVGLIDS